jgi:peptidoglycan/xylan/chitin deacetylase (PgdA/CDA1 family)
MPHLSDEGLAFDLATAEAAILEATGVDPKPWFRCPFGAGSDDPRVLAAVAEAGYRHVGWTAEAFDFEPDRPVEELERLIVDGVLAKRDDAIALLHTWPYRTELALPGIVSRLRGAGAELVRVDELAAVEALPAPEAHGATHLQAE